MVCCTRCTCRTGPHTQHCENAQAVRRQQKRGRVGCGGRWSGGAGDGGGGRGAGEAGAGGAVAGLDARGGGVFIVGERAAVLLRVSRPARVAGKVECHVGDGTPSVEVSAVN